MKRQLNLWIIGVSIVLLFISLAYPQEGKESFLKKQRQAEIAPDSDQYVIGPEDILYVHVWKEEVLSKSVSVRMTAKKPSVFGR